MANKNKLSVYLVKEGLFEKEDLFENPDELDILETLSDGSPIYYKASDVHAPSWLKSLIMKNDNEDMLQANSRVILLKKKVENYFLFCYFISFKNVSEVYLQILELIAKYIAGLNFASFS